MFKLATLSAKPARANASKAKAAHLRVQKDISELTKSKTWSLDFSDVNDLLNSRLTLSPDEGFYKGGRFTFSFKVGLSYPHEPPKVKCETKVYHPNIDLDGNICLNILREDWKPVLTLNCIIIGLHFLFLAPNPDDPLNKEAAEMLKTNKKEFERNVQRFLNAR